MSAAPIHADNAAQAEYWNANAGQKWTEHQEHQDQVLRPVSDRLIAAAKPKPGERVIDVGCGCGATTIEFAERVGPGGAVLGLDVSEPMLARARERAPQDLPIRFELADATVYDFEPARRRPRGVAVRRHVLRRSGDVVRQSAQGAQTRRTACLRLLARGQAKPVLHPAAARSRQARPSPARDGPRGARPVRLRERGAGAPNPERRGLRRHRTRAAGSRARHRGRPRTRHRRPAPR